jgi:predicted nuclease of restriction endonuclease-like (RecB) superfamily
MAKKRTPPKKTVATTAGSFPLPPARQPADGSQPEFEVVLQLINEARSRTASYANTTLIDLYWSIGEFISGRISSAAWGEGTVQALAEHIRRHRPNVRGFSAQNLWRMRQFYETYRSRPELSALLRELSWTNNMLILGKSKRPEEREFYLRLASTQKWSSRELERQIGGALFERVALSPAILSAPLREIHPDAALVFRDSYLVEFLELQHPHSEAELQQALLEQLKRFLIELGRDFCFVGSEHPVQVGGRDFAIDLLFFNRALNCLVAIELKVGEFEPEYLGKLQFYLEALDRDVRKPHERPSIGVLLCATKNQEVVEYALSRTMSPALVSEYQTKLPDKGMLQRKLHEFYARAEVEGGTERVLPPVDPAKNPSASRRRRLKPRRSDE